MFTSGAPPSASLGLLILGFFQQSHVSKMIAEGNNIKYTVLAKGTVVPEGLPDDGRNNHIYTWRIAYTIEGLRDWLFTQVKTTN